MRRCGFRLGERRREHGHGFDDVEAGAAQKLVDDRLGEAGGVVLDADGLFGFVQRDATNAIDFADFCDGKGSGLGGWHSVAVQNIKLGHASMIAAARAYGESIRRIEAMGISLVEGTFAGLIFDCDGTLVDTAPAHLAALQVGLDAYGLTMAKEWYFPRGGLTPDALMNDYEVLLGRTVPREDILARHKAAFQEELQGLQEVTVIAEIAREWHGRVPMAVASNGRRQNVEASLTVTKLLPLFDYVVTAEDVARGKPEPDVFLEAARRMGVAAADCIVFEDTDEGLEGARRAGMRRIDIREYFMPVR